MMESILLLHISTYSGDAVILCTKCNMSCVASIVPKSTNVGRVISVHTLWVHCTKT